MKEVRTSEVKRFLLREGYVLARQGGEHEWWSRHGSRSIPLPRKRTITPGVLRDIEKAVGHVPPKLEVSPEMKTYLANAVREQSWWLIDVPEINYRTQARTVSEIEQMARDLVAGALNIAPDSFNVQVELFRPSDVDSTLARAAALDQEGRKALASAAATRRQAAKTLRTRYGLTVADTAAVLGVTRARAYQLLSEPKNQPNQLAAALH